MTRYEYKVVPAPAQGRKAKGVRDTAGRFALALETLMNELGAQGWDYVRSDTLPCEERTGLTGRTTTFQNMLVFRRPIPAAEDEVEAAPAISGLLAAPLPEAETAGPAPGPRAAAGAGGGAGGGVHKEPPLTRAAEPAPREASEAARAAAAALRTYRASSASQDAPGGKGGKGGGLAAE